MKIASIALFAAIAVVLLVVVYTQMIHPISVKDQACLNSGGIVGTSLCCKSANDFPNNCLIGACGCSPTNSHEVKTCECPSGKCFDGNSCVNAS